MKKSRKKKNVGLQCSDTEAQEKKKLPIGLALILAVNTVIVFSVYHLLVNFKYFEIVLIIYMVILSVSMLSYVIYNRGFSRKGLTPEMLPDDMTPEEKEAFILDGKTRLKKSKWLLTVIFPFLFTFGFDAFSWLITDYLLPLFK